MSLLRILRIAILLTLLVAVAGNHWAGLSRLADWERPLWVTVYPIVADGRAATREYVKVMGPERFADVGEFLTREAARYGLPLTNPVHVQLAAAGEALPPPSPTGGNRLAIALWSLRMRWWAWRQEAADGLPEADIQMFVLYREGREGAVLDRSLGVRRGRYGVVNAFAAPSQSSSNRVVLTHELLHVLGASDKYDPASGQPLVPHGLAAPQKQPLYPQTRAEIMGGRIAESPRRARMPSSLAQCVIGTDSAREIGWLNGGKP